MAHLNKESVEEASILKTVHKNVTNKKSAEKDRKKAVKTVKDIHRGKYAGVKMANEDVVLEEAMLNEFSDAQLAQLKKAYADLERINVTSPTYKKMKAMIAKMDVKALEKVARAKVKFVSQIAAREYEAKSGNRLKAKDYMESVNEAIGKLGPNASREDKIKHTMKIMKMYPANKGKSEKQLRKGATDYIDQFTNKNKRDNAYIAKMKAKKESVEEATNESVNIEEKNVPTNPSLWAKTKAQAKAKFDVYPSAYANGWAAKKYKAAGGGWKSVKEQKTFWDVRKK